MLVCGLFFLTVLYRFWEWNPLAALCEAEMCGKMRIRFLILRSGGKIPILPLNIFSYGGESCIIKKAGSAVVLSPLVIQRSVKRNY